MFKKITLKNGLRIILVPQKSSRAVTVLTLVGTGSKYETREINGISHFLEHLYFKGTKKRPNPLAVAEAMDKLGGSFNAFTGEEYTGYYAKVGSPHFEAALEWVADIYLNSLLPKKDIEKERGVIIEELNMYLDTPMLYIGELWKSLLYGDQPAGWKILGTRENIARLSQQDFLDYRKSHYLAGNTVVCLAGNFPVFSQAIKKIEKYFSGMEKAGKPIKQPVIERQKQPEVLFFPKKTDQTHLALGVRTFSDLSDSRKYPLKVMSVILGGMMSSRLFTEVREKLSLAYYVKTDIESDTDTGSLVTLAGVDSSRAEKAVSTILKEYRKISRIKVSATELKKAKENLKGKLSLSLESSDAKASFCAGQELLEGQILKPEDIFKKIDKVSVNDILKTAREIFRPENLNLAVIGPAKDKGRWKKILKV